jgi:hypothetical protein
MTSPLRKEKTEELTTADIAGGQRKSVTDAIEQGRGRPVLSQREPVEITHPQSAQPMRSTASGATDATPLFPDQELEDLRKRWDGIQTGFVDQPRNAVEQADNLVASTMKRLADVFAQERSKLEGQWDSGDNVSTEDLRLALQRYRSFFHRLLSI